MVKLRMRRTGCNNHAAYRIVAADERSPNNFKLDLERCDYWLSKGAKASETVASLIRRARNPELKPHHARKVAKQQKKAKKA